MRWCDHPFHESIIRPADAILCGYTPYPVEDFSSLGLGFVVVWIIAYTAIIGGWVWALVAAAGGSRRALVVLLVYALLTALWFGLGSLVQYASMPAEFIIFSLSLITGALASLSVALQLRSTRRDSNVLKP